MLLKRCQELERCVAFTSNGELKTRVSSMEEMPSVSDGGDGLYVAEMDLCAADLHSCSSNARCVSQGPGKYDCVCPDGLWGENCIPRLAEGHSFSDKLSSEDESDQEWINLKHSADFVFFQGVDSPGGDYIFAEQHKGNIDALKRMCMDIKPCLAFHTNGVLKSSVQWGTEWIPKMGSAEEGLHVLDVDYCSKGINDCPEYSYCRRLGAGNYSCVCEPGLAMSTVEFTGRKSCLPVDWQTQMSSIFTHEQFCVGEEECDIPDE
jgi:hypothetical protein